MTFIERFLRRLAAVTPVTVGRDFRRAAAVSRSLDHENVATDAAGVRLAGTRRARARMYFDVPGGLAVFGASSQTWDWLSPANKAVLVPVGTEVCTYAIGTDVAAADAIQYRGATIDFPDGRQQLISASFEIRRDPGAVVIDTINLTSASPFRNLSTVGQGAPPGGTTRYYIVLSAAHFNDDPLIADKDVIGYEVLTIGAVLHFSTRPVTW